MAWRCTGCCHVGFFDCQARLLLQILQVQNRVPDLACFSFEPEPGTFHQIARCFEPESGVFHQITRRLELDPVDLYSMDQHFLDALDELDVLSK
jgi:hypothetical protein